MTEVHILRMSPVKKIYLRMILLAREWETDEIKERKGAAQSIFIYLLRNEACKKINEQEYMYHYLKKHYSISVDLMLQKFLSTLEVDIQKNDYKKIAHSAYKLTHEVDRILVSALQDVKTMRKKAVEVEHETLGKAEPEIIDRRKAHL